jgi:membrane protease YdiL (CAAX protease family)
MKKVENNKSNKISKTNKDNDKSTNGRRIDKRKKMMRIALVLVIIVSITAAEVLLYVYGQFSDLSIESSPELITYRQDPLNITGNQFENGDFEFYTLELNFKLINRGRINADDIIVFARLHVTNATGLIKINSPLIVPEFSTLGILATKSFNLTFIDVPFNYDNKIELFMEIEESGGVSEKVSILLKSDKSDFFNSELTLSSEDLLERSSNIFYLAAGIEGILVLVTTILGLIIIKDRLLALTVSSLGLAPLFRILNIATPLSIDFLVFVTMSYGLLLVAVFIFIYVHKIPKDDLGFTFNKFHIYLFIAIMLGLLLAPIEYVILGPPPWIPEPTIYNLVVLTLVMVFFVGLAEELMFRALIQTHLEKLFSPIIGLVLTSVLFCVMHGVWTNSLEFVFTFAAGLLFGYIFQRTRNLPFVAVLHGAEDVFLFGLLPFIM